MINLKKEKCLDLKQARRKAGISQSELAAEVGCKQSAISMFESGDPTKLSDDIVEKIAKKFDISLTETVSANSVVPARNVTIAGEHGFCPNPECPSNHRYMVQGQVFMEPDRNAADPVGAKFCAKCGEVLEKHCPNCGSHLHDGAVCSYCGRTYITV